MAFLFSGGLSRLFESFLSLAAFNLRCFFVFSTSKNTLIFLWHPNYPNQIVKECIHFDVLSSHGCKWRRSYSGLVRDGHLWSPMPPWNDGGISCSPKKKVLPNDSFKTTFRIWHFQLEGQAMSFCQVFTKWMGNVTPLMVIDIPGKSGLAGIASWEYHEIPICNKKCPGNLQKLAPKQFGSTNSCIKPASRM